MEKAKHVTWRLLAAGVCLLTVSSVARADSLDEQRSRYAQIKQAWDNRQMDVVEQMMPGLKDYPLYPYLEYRQITDDLMNQPAVTVTNFVRANPTLPPARTLQSRFVNELARREDWRGLLAFSPEKPGTTEAQCNYYYAKWNTGQSEEAWQGAKELWLTGKSQPNACEPCDSAEYRQWISSHWDEELIRRRRNYTKPYMQNEAHIQWIAEPGWCFERAAYDRMVEAFRDVYKAGGKR